MNQPTTNRRRRRLAVAGASILFLAPAAASATTDTTEATDDTAAAGEVPEGALTELGEGEGEVNLIAWAGYIEDGSTDPEVDWVTGFEEETGCDGQRPPRQLLRRDGAAHAERRVRRRVGVG